MKFINITSANIKNSSTNKGFTLIELIIVIGVLGVLAAALLIAIDPLEQLARGRDSGRISSVTQIGRALQAYYAGQTLSAYPAVPAIAGTWQDALVTSGDIKTKVTVNPLPKWGCNNNGAGITGVDMEGNVCYTQLTKVTAGDDAAIWVGLDSKSSASKWLAGAGSACPATSFVVAAYIVSHGSTGIDCVAKTATPLSGDTLY
jgi:prepilin-type N-terminal cleavage/methylation domain-containing protein